MVLGGFLSLGYWGKAVLKRGAAVKGTEKGKGRQMIVSLLVSLLFVFGGGGFDGGREEWQYVEGWRGCT